MTGWSSGYDVCPDIERPGLDSLLRQRIFSDHLLDPLLHLVANVISKLKMHEDMLSPWRGECDSDQVVLVV